MRPFVYFCRARPEQRFLEDRLESPSQPMTSGKAGFSLVELMVVVGIVVVTGTISMSGVESFKRAMDKSPMEQVLADLRLARAMAASEKRDVQITFNNDAHQYSMWVDRNGNGNVDSGEIELTILDNSGVTLLTSPHTGTFRPDGTFVTDSFMLFVSVLTPSGYTRLHVSPSGYAYIIDGVL